MLYSIAWVSNTVPAETCRILCALSSIVKARIMTIGNILVVEDESVIALDIKRTLSKAGYNVVGVAISAEDAIAQVVEFQPDLVLMDISIEGEIDGIDTAAYIHETYQIPIIYLTAHSDEATLRRAKATPTFGYLLKPFDRHDLTMMIEIALSKHKAELAIREALREQQELNALKSRFISVVSHEFRNPLNVVLVSAELLEQYIELSRFDKQKTCVQRIRSSIEQMNQLVDNVLTLSETEIANLQCEPHLIDLVAFCRLLYEDAQLLLSDRHRLFCWIKDSQQSGPLYAIDSEFAPQFKTCMDTKLLQPILKNLLSNAIKYSPKGGEIQFHCTYAPEETTFQVRDQGIGIPSADQARLFHSFYRASNVEMIPGNGLGLSIVKQYVELHGGQIQVESQENQGTTVTVSIPRIHFCSAMLR
jgi:signal transduction histidine kinase